MLAQPVAPAPVDDVITTTLKRRYFEILPKEAYPNTPEITAEADHLERAIRDQQARARVGNAS